MFVGIDYKLHKLLSLNGQRMKDAKRQVYQVLADKFKWHFYAAMATSNTDARESAMDNFAVSHWSHWVCLPLTPVTVKCCNLYRTQILALQQ